MDEQIQGGATTQMPLAEPLLLPPPRRLSTNWPQPTLWSRAARGVRWLSGALRPHHLPPLLVPLWVKTMLEQDEFAIFVAIVGADVKVCSLMFVQFLLLAVVFTHFNAVVLKKLSVKAMAFTLLCVIASFFRDTLHVVPASICTAVWRPLCLAFRLEHCSVDSAPLATSANMTQNMTQNLTMNVTNATANAMGSVSECAVLVHGPLCLILNWQDRATLWGSIIWLYAVIRSASRTAYRCSRRFRVFRRSACFQCLGPVSGDEMFIETSMVFCGATVATSPLFVAPMWFFIRPWGQLALMVEGRRPHIMWEEAAAYLLVMWALSHLQRQRRTHLENMRRDAEREALQRERTEREQEATRQAAEGAKRGAREKLEERILAALQSPFSAELGGADVRAERASPERGPEEGDLESGNSCASGLVRSLSSQVMSQGEEVAAPVPELLKQKRDLLKTIRQDALSEDPLPLPVARQLLMTQIRREHILEDSLQQLLDAPLWELLASRIQVTFAGEFGSDAGGVARDWFDAVALALHDGSEVCRGGTSLFALESDRTLVPRPFPGADDENPTEESIKRFRRFLAVGRFLAIAVLHDQPLPLSLGTVAAKQLLEKKLGYGDVRRLDPSFFEYRVTPLLKQGGLSDIVDALGESLMFVGAATELRPEPQALKPGGASLAVTEETKREYLRLLCNDRLSGGMGRQVRMLIQGFHEVLPFNILQCCDVSPRELAVLVAGMRDIDAEDWRAHAEVGSPRGSEHALRVRAWFWEVLPELTGEQRCLLLHYATGQSRLPFGGFADLRPAFRLSTTAETAEHLPTAHTCNNELRLPRYESKEQLQQRLETAISVEGPGFGFS